MRTRFAPAPTGWLHLGHVLNAGYVWEAARMFGASVVLRIEDHDRERCRPEFEQGILNDLDWLGFQPDVYPTSCFRRGVCAGRQSNRHDIHLAAARSLADRGLLFGCDCSRRDLADAPMSEDGERIYPGRCRDRELPLTEGVGWRLRLDPGEETFDDLELGPQRQDPAQQCGDLLIRDRLGNWTYQFAAAVDDLQMDIGLVVRGTDLLTSTGRQIRLARLLGRSRPPAFLHHRLIMKTADQKLSKSDADTGIRDLRARGWTVADVLESALGGGVTIRKV